MTAPSSAASLALASFAEASFKFAFLSAISITSLLPTAGQLDLGQGDVTRTRRLEFRTVERHPDATERLTERLRQMFGGSPTCCGRRDPRPSGRTLATVRCGQNGASRARRSLRRQALRSTCACSLLGARRDRRQGEEARLARAPGAAPDRRSSINGAGRARIPRPPRRSARSPSPAGSRGRRG